MCSFQHWDPRAETPDDMAPRENPTAILATRLYEPESAAAAYRLGNLTRSLERRGWLVTVLTTKSRYETRSTRTVRRWPVLRDKSGAVRGYLQYLSFDVPLFFRLLFSRRADLVVVEPPPTTGLVVRIVCWLKRTPYVYYSADVMTSALNAVGVNTLVRRTVSGMEKWVLDGAAGVLAVTDGVSRELQGLGSDPAKITVTGTGIDTAIFLPDGEAEPDEPPYFVYAGTMSEFQGALAFVEAFGAIATDFPEARLVMFGGGIDLDTMRDAAVGLGGRVQFPGFVDASTVARWTRGARASLASLRPGQGYDFAFPTKALASVACGTPVIFAGVGPLRDLVADHSLGWSVDWEVDQIAAAMTEALQNTRRRLDSATVQWVDDRFSLRGVADRAVEAIASVARRSRGERDQ